MSHDSSTTLKLQALVCTVPGFQLNVALKMLKYNIDLCHVVCCSGLHLWDLLLLNVLTSRA